MGTGFAVRALERKDQAQWRELWAAYNAFYERVGPTALGEEVVRTTWERLLDSSEPMHALVAESEGRLLGLAHYVFHRSTSQIALACYLQDLYTREDVRGRGVGRALIEAVYERAREAGSPRVYWQTHETNARAMRLYDQVAERSGFIVYRKPV
ncbi:MAG TPA: GNAT family N-acetyltransferase [Usitatibacter sp.]|nr:GNAT family N-acetyltransferase [Usitatibacter sp.]